MSHSLSSLKGVILGSIIGVIKGYSGTVAHMNVPFWYP